jgi:hypothetical protein
MRILVVAAVALSVAGCARTSAMPLAGDTVAITTSAAPMCGAAGAQTVAARQAAVETIRRGFDSYRIVDGQYQNNIGVVGHTPITAHSTGNAYASGGMVYGQSRTTYSGGQPIMGGSHNQALIVKMFKDGDPAAANAISARATLGPKWKEAVEGNSATCM